MWAFEDAFSGHLNLLDLFLVNVGRGRDADLAQHGIAIADVDGDGLSDMAAAGLAAVAARTVRDII